jgi:hypothetical protein
VTIRSWREADADELSATIAASIGHLRLFRALGFRLVGAQAREVTAPAETGVHRIRRVARADWVARTAT